MSVLAVAIKAALLLQPGTKQEAPEFVVVTGGGF